MFAHAVAVSADVDDVAVVDQAINQRGGHGLVAKELVPLLEGLVADDIFLALKKRYRCGAGGLRPLPTRRAS